MSKYYTKEELNEMDNVELEFMLNDLFERWDEIGLTPAQAKVQKMIEEILEERRKIIKEMENLL